MGRVIIFDVEHGFCAFVKSSTGRTLLIDCGKGSLFSPVDYIIENELHDTVSFSGHRLTQLLVTHPHNDHIEDVESVITKLPPYLLRRQIYNWENVKQEGSGDGDYENLDMYSAWQGNYNMPAPRVDWGMNIQTFGLTPREALALEGSYVNNSGLVTVVTFTGTQFTEKFLFGADVEEAGWEALLERPDFVEAVHGTDFFIVPHHGHTSGFSENLFAAMGRPILNLISVRSGDEFIDCRYQCEDHAIGAELNGERRYSLSTRADGSIFVDVDAEGRYRVHTYELDSSLLAKLFLGERFRR